jgi:hypothetical protein
MNIRRAVPEDVIQIGQMLRRFYTQHGEVYSIKYDHASCLSSVLETIMRGICLIGPKSCAGALILPFPYNREALVAQVLFWYVERGREIAIFDVLMANCRREGATHVNVATVAPKHVGKRFYAVRGLKLAEAQYLGPV